MGEFQNPENTYPEAPDAPHIPEERDLRDLRPRPEDVTDLAIPPGYPVPGRSGGEDAEGGFSRYRLPPQNIEAEEALLSAIMLDNSTLLEIMGLLEPDDFYAPSHRLIFTGVMELFRKNEPVDLVTLAGHLRDTGRIDRISGGGYEGVTYLSYLTDAVPRAVNAPYYAKNIRDKSLLRRMITTAAAISEKCYDSRGEVERVMDFAETSVMGVTASRVSRAFHPLSVIIESNIDALEERQGSKTLITGVPTGFSVIDRMTSGFQPSDLIILAARPSMGKTSFAMNIARNAALDTGVPVGVFSLEMSKEQLSMRLLCSEARVDSSRLRSGFFSNEDWNAITDAAGALMEAPLFIDDSAGLNVIEIRAKCRRLQAEHGLGMVVVDYLQLMRGSTASAERRDLEISEISRSLKALAKELNIPVLALSQLNRKLEERSDKRPMLSDLRESGSIEQDADVVAFIYRDEVYNKDENNPGRGKAEIILGKQRNGPIGTAHLAFLTSYTRFEDLAPESMMPEHMPSS